MTDTDKKTIEKYKNLILDIPGIKSAEYVNSITSSVTLSWGANLFRCFDPHFGTSSSKKCTSFKIFKTMGERI